MYYNSIINKSQFKNKKLERVSWLIMSLIQLVWESNKTMIAELFSILNDTNFFLGTLKWHNKCLLFLNNMVKLLILDK